MRIKVLTEEDVYRIALLTHTGWEYDTERDAWWKEGMIDCDGQKYYSREDAYWESM